VAQHRPGRPSGPRAGRSPSARSSGLSSRSSWSAARCARQSSARGPEHGSGSAPSPARGTMSSANEQRGHHLPGRRVLRRVRPGGLRGVDPPARLELVQPLGTSAPARPSCRCTCSPR
jgi:hypothetical protein